MTKDVDTYQIPTLARIVAAKTPAERAKLQSEAVEKITDDRFSRPVPRFITELPHTGSDEEIALRIASAVLVAEDPESVQDGGETIASKTITGRKVIVHDLRAMDSDKEGGVGAYLLLDVTVGDDEVHQIVTTGAIQAMARLARAYAEDGLPITGAFEEIPGTGSKGSPALTFRVEKPF